MPESSEAVQALREASSEWASEYDRLTRESPNQVKVRAAYRLAAQLAAQRADALVAVLRPAIQPERDRVMGEVRNFCPHEDEHPEGCCDICDFASAVDTVLSEHFDRLAAEGDGR